MAGWWLVVKKNTSKSHFYSLQNCLLYFEAWAIFISYHINYIYIYIYIIHSLNENQGSKEVVVFVGPFFGTTKLAELY